MRTILLYIYAYCILYYIFIYVLYIEYIKTGLCTKAEVLANIFNKMKVCYQGIFL